MLTLEREKNIYTGTQERKGKMEERRHAERKSSQERARPSLVESIDC